MVSRMTAERGGFKEKVVKDENLSLCHSGMARKLGKLPRAGVHFDLVGHTGRN
jgi:hypothetical protein